MKKLGIAIILLSVSFGFIACGKKSDKEQSDSLTSPSNTCLVQNCDNTEYSNNSQYGFTGFNDPSWNGQPYLVAQQSASYYNYNNYNYNYTGYNSGSFQSGYFCGCNQGYTPVYNAARGFGCVNSRAIQNIAHIMVYWTVLANQQNFSAFDSATANTFVQQSAGTGYNYNNYNYYNYGNYNQNGRCSNFVAEACHVNLPEACRNGYTCQATVYGSSMGVCVK